MNKQIRNKYLPANQQRFSANLGLRKLVSWGSWGTKSDTAPMNTIINGTPHA